MYEVIRFFTDLQDFNHPYNVGEKFPREGMKVSEERLKELSSSANRRKEPLIRLVENSVKECVEEKPFTKTEINRLSVSDLKKLAKEKKISGYKDMTGVDLKKALIAKFDL